MFIMLEANVYNLGVVALKMYSKRQLSEKLNQTKSEPCGVGLKSLWKKAKFLKQRTRN